MSDWGATHSTSINAGLDQEMPGGRFMSNDELGKMVTQGTLAAAKIDDSALRILTPLIAVGAFDLPNSGTTAVNASSDAHNAACRQLSAKSTVLLKNDAGLLPLDAGGSNLNIAVIGEQAVGGGIVHGGGSGQVYPPYVIDPLTGIRLALGIALPPAPPAVPNNCSGGAYEKGFDYFNQVDQTRTGATSAEECCKHCADREPMGGKPCVAFTLTGNDCWMKGSAEGRKASAGCTAGRCGPPVPTPAPAPDPAARCNANNVCVDYASGNDAAAAAAAAAKADVALVFVGTTSSEGGDRGDLLLGGGQEELIAAVAKAQKQVVVVAVTPGAILSDWSGSVAAVLAPFMPGQEYGNAIADIIFGKVNPSAKLPLTFPNTENEVEFAQGDWPGVNGQANYTEGLNVGYRWYNAHKKEPKFAFGHGTLPRTSITLLATTLCTGTHR